MSLCADELIHSHPKPTGAGVGHARIAKPVSPQARVRDIW